MTSEIQSEVEVSSTLPEDLEIETKFESSMQRLSTAIDSPKTLLIARNVLLTLLEVEGKVDERLMLFLLKDKEYRQGIVTRLASDTPDFWDEAWKQAWKKQIDPLYSSEQQRIVRRRSLISFWTKEWDTLPKDQVKHVIAALQVPA